MASLSCTNAVIPIPSSDSRRIGSVVAGFIPARNASRVDPIQALQKGRYQVLSAGENRIRRAAAITLGSASAALLMFAGRVGPLTLAAVVVGDAAPGCWRHPEEKVMVG